MQEQQPFYATSLREDTLDLDDDAKMSLIEEHFSAIMEVLGLDLADASLKGTPKRVAKMYVKELFSGLNPANRPSIPSVPSRACGKLSNYDIVDLRAFDNGSDIRYFIPAFPPGHTGIVSESRDQRKRLQATLGDPDALQ